MKDSSEKPLKPVYLIHGKEPFLLDEALDRLKARLEKESPAGLDIAVFTGSVVDPGEILSALETLPLMAERRLVIVKEAEKLSSAMESTLLGYVKRPSDTVCLVLVFGDLRKDRKLYRALNAKNQVFEYALARGRYPLWIEDRFAKRSKRVEGEGTACLVQEIGFDLARLENEIEKICLFYEDKERMGAEEIRQIISAGREIDVYDLVDALAEKNSTRALVLLRRLLEKDEKGMSLFHPLLRHFKGLLKTKAYWEKGVRGQELQRALSVAPFIVKKYQNQIGRFSLEELKGVYLFLAEADFCAKSDRREMGLSLEILASRIGREVR
jgi:DNA polymerase-3 subunit delta